MNETAATAPRTYNTKQDMAQALANANCSNVSKEYLVRGFLRCTKAELAEMIRLRRARGADL